MKDNLPYAEAHHLIQISFQVDFQHSLDIEDNVISLCSHCHREIHYGANRRQLLNHLHTERKDKLKKHNIFITFDELCKMYNV